MRADREYRRNNMHGQSIGKKVNQKTIPEKVPASEAQKGLCGGGGDHDQQRSHHDHHRDDVSVATKTPVTGTKAAPAAVTAQNDGLSTAEPARNASLHVPRLEFSGVGKHGRRACESKVITGPAVFIRLAEAIAPVLSNPSPARSRASAEVSTPDNRLRAASSSRFTPVPSHAVQVHCPAPPQRLQELADGKAGPSPLANASLQKGPRVDVISIKCNN